MNERHPAAHIAAALRLRREPYVAAVLAGLRNPATVQVLRYLQAAGRGAALLRGGWRPR